MLETEFVIVACLKSFSKELEVFQMKEVSVKKLTLHWGGVLFGRFEGLFVCSSLLLLTFARGMIFEMGR